MLRGFDHTRNNPRKKGNSEFSRILSAAVIDSVFRCNLLNSPKNTIESGYKGEFFNLKPQERIKISSICVTNLNDFADAISQI